MIVWALGCAGGGKGDAADTAIPLTNDSGSADSADSSPPIEGRLGRTWRFDLRTATIPEPAKAGELLRSYLGSHLLVQVVGEGEGAMSLRLAWSEGDADAQAPGVPTADVAASPDEGTFTSAPTQLLFHALDGMACESLVLTGTMSADYAEVDDASVAFRGDTAALMDILSEEEPTAFCDLLESFGGACETCDSTAETCAWFRFEGMTEIGRAHV